MLICKNVFGEATQATVGELRHCEPGEKDGASVRLTPSLAIARFFDQLEIRETSTHQFHFIHLVIVDIASPLGKGSGDGVHVVRARRGRQLGRDAEHHLPAWRLVPQAHNRIILYFILL